MLGPEMSRDDLNELLTGAVELAVDHLAALSEFAPFALAMQAADGEILHLSPEDEGAVDDPEQVRAVLIAGLREGAQAGRYRAVAIVTDVTVEDESGEAVTSAIQISMEHADDDPVTCIVPYAISGEQVELADLSAEEGERLIFQETFDN
jgi:hypothetical protein